MGVFHRIFTRTERLKMPRDSTRNFSSKREFAAYVGDQFETIDKDSLIVSLCRSKDVLDIGCIDHSYITALGLGENWLHHQIKQVATRLVGLDILEADAKRLADHGYTIIPGDAQSFNLNRTFDTIVVGDLIEHLGNIGSFLVSLRDHLADESIAIITTPNPFNIEQTMLGTFQGEIVVNDQHTVWLDPKVMYELVGRFGLRVVDFYWIDTRFKLRVRRPFFRKIANVLSELIMRVRPVLRRDFAIILAKDEH